MEDRYEGLLYHNEIFEPLSLGETKTVYLKKRRSDGKLDLSLKRLGAKGAKTSQEKILTLLKKHNGKLPFTSKSDAETIVEFFGMSKKEFKRTLVILQEKGAIKANSNGIAL